jgi:hypothetical protein
VPAPTRTWAVAIVTSSRFQMSRAVRDEAAKRAGLRIR